MLVKSFVLCKQIRQENTGKFMLLGVFGTDTIVNNQPVESRWANPMFLSALFAMEIHRETDASLYSVKVEADNGGVLTPELTLEIKKEDASYLQFPLNIALQLNGPSKVRLNIYRMEFAELVAEICLFKVVNAEH